MRPDRRPGRLRLGGGDAGDWGRGWLPGSGLRDGRWWGSWEEELVVSVRGPRDVQVTGAMLGAQDVSLGDSVCLVVHATEADKIAHGERVVPGSTSETDLPGLWTGRRWVCPQDGISSREQVWDVAR